MDGQQCPRQGLTLQPEWIPTDVPCEGNPKDSSTSGEPGRLSGMPMAEGMGCWVEDCSRAPCAEASYSPSVQLLGRPVLGTNSQHFHIKAALELCSTSTQQQSHEKVLAAPSQSLQAGSQGPTWCRACVGEQTALFCRIMLDTLSLEGVSQTVYILPERLLALVRPAFDLVLRRIRSLKTLRGGVRLQNRDP